MSLVQYRYAIGNNNIQKCNLVINSTQEKLTSSLFKFDLYILLLLYIFFISYIFIYIQLSSLQSSKSYHFTSRQHCKKLFCDLSHISNLETQSFLGHTNMAYLFIIAKVIINNITISNSFKRFLSSSLSTIRQFVEVSLLLYISSINIIRIIISNCSLLNPGPTNKTKNESNIKVFYQNVHGLITFGSIDDKHPVLNIAKIIELQSYISFYQPDIVILNETWLKP